ncbi:MAG: prephenate dehydrogenase [Longimicrobiales bacterium]
MRVIIAGLGFMGASLARSIHRAGNHTVVGVDIDPAARAAALASGANQVYASLSDFDWLCDVIVFATPAGVTISLLPANAPRLKRTPLVMDIGSVKGPVMQAARAAGLERVFVGTNPVCIRESTGFDAARADLYDGTPVWLVADDDAPVDAAEIFWRIAGAAALRRTDADAHDALIGAASHLPQLVASVLAGTLADLAIARERLGPAGRDATRLAGSNPATAVDMLMQNRASLLDPLARFADRLQRVRRALDRGDENELRSLLDEAAMWQRHR